jgi:hypothetical protein
MVAPLVLRFLFFLLLACCFFHLLGLCPFTRKKQEDLQANERKNDTEEMVLDPHCHVMYLGVNRYHAGDTISVVKNARDTIWRKWREFLSRRCPL